VRRGERSLGTALLFGRKLRRTLQESRYARPAAAAARLLRQALELGRHLLVGTCSRLGEMPCATIAVELRIGRGSQRRMRLLPRLQRCALVDG
jgi:hypothetical protein